MPGEQQWELLYAFGTKSRRAKVRFLLEKKFIAQAIVSELLLYVYYNYVIRIPPRYLGTALEVYFLATTNRITAMAIPMTQYTVLISLLCFSWVI
jgi:hypothetical protein